MSPGCGQMPTAEQACVVSDVCAVGTTAVVAGVSGEVEQFMMFVPLKPCALLLCRGAWVCVSGTCP